MVNQPISTTDDKSDGKHNLDVTIVNPTPNKYLTMMAQRSGHSPAKAK